jgi:hypothetical protein
MKQFIRRQITVEAHPVPARQRISITESLVEKSMLVAGMFATSGGMSEPFPVIKPLTGVAR